jgi:geranylgeranyl diphosphate synthase type I
MTFQKNLEKQRSLIKEHFRNYFAQKRKDFLPQIFKEQGLVESLEDFAIRGKLIRGSLFLFASEMLGLALKEELIDIACAIELMHSALLIQDDIIDNDYIRRKERTIFAKFEDYGKRIEAFDPYHYGVSNAIIVADIAFFYAIDLLSNFSDLQFNILLKNYANEVYLVTLAEAADSLFGQTKKEATKEDIYAIYRYKTARYTFSLPLEMAAIAADALPTLREKLNTMGELIGTIYQLKDDELGLFSNEETIGKPVGSDIREKKKTILRYILFKEDDQNERKTLENCFGNPEITEGEIEIVRNIYKKYGINKYIEKEINGIMDKAWNIYESLEIKEEYKKILKELLEFNLKRTA